MMGDLAPPLSTGPDIAADAQTAALVRVIALSQIHPPPITTYLLRSNGESGRHPRPYPSWTRTLT